MTMINKCKICGGVNCQCKNKNTREEDQARAEQNTYEDNSNVGGLVIDDTGDCESCQQRMPKKKLWKKPVGKVFDVGICRYCKKSMTSDDSFVAFADKTKAHYSCMVQDDQQRSLDKTYE